VCYTAAKFLGLSLRQPSSKNRIFRFGTYEVNTFEGTLTKGGTRVKLQEQPFLILTLLLENPGQLVTREEIRSVLWPADTFVEFDDVLNTSVRKLRAALNDSADNPRFLETVPRRGYRFLAPVSVLETEALSTGMPVGTGEAVSPETAGQVRPIGSASSNRLRYWIAAVLVVLLVGGTSYLFRSVRPSSARASGSMPAIPTRRSVAVLGFRNLPGRPEEDWLARALTEMLSTELAAGGSLRLVSGEDVARAKHDLRIADADSFSQSTLADLRINPGADVVVLGSYTPLQGKDQKRIRVDIRLQDTASGETISEDAFTGAEGSLFEVASEAGARLRQRLGQRALTAEASNAALASLPSNEQALRLYAEGRAKLSAFDYLAARDLLVKAVAADPANAAAQGALADAWSALGYTATAQEEAKRALDLSSNLPREEQLLAEGRYRGLARDWPKAIETYRALARFFPDNLEYGLRLAAVLSKDGKEQESLLAVEALRRLPKPIADDPRVDLQEAYTLTAAGDYPRARIASASAASKAQKRGSRMLLAEAKLLQSQAATRQDDPKGALALDEEALDIYEQAGDKFGVARARYRMGDLLYRQGHLAQSNAILEQCLRDFRALGNDSNVASTLNDIAVGLTEMGENNRAKSMYEQALVAERLVRNKRGIADTLNNLGALVARQGDLAAATKYNDEALALYQELGEKDAIAFMQLNMGGVLLAQGNLAEAKNLLDQSLAAQRTLGNSSDVAEALHNVAEALGYQGDVAGAQKAYDEALAIRISRGEQGNVAQTRLGKADLLLTTGNAADSEPLARSALEQFAKDKQASDELSARGTLAQVLLQLGRLPEAKAEVAQATKLADRNETPSLRLKTDVVAARILSAEGKTELAARKLRLTIQESQKRGFFIRRLEAALALAEIEAKSGKKAEARAMLQAVERDARSKGFLLVARQAQADRAL
jgi:DNA-binding winged helix-turn-helix (wHTH) protein/tetratricopeptide (TPR) repeat protein